MDLIEMKYPSYEEYMTGKRAESKVLGTGYYKDYEWFIISYFTHPCAYVVAKENNAIYGVNYNEIDFIDVHGGLTYSDWGLSNNKSEDFWVIGWDYAHYGDYLPYDLSEDNKRWTTEEIYEHVKDVINQIKGEESD